MKRGHLNVINVSELEELKDKIQFVEKENQELKSAKNEYISSSQERLTLFLKLCRKYVKKIKNIVILFSKLETSNLQSVIENRDLMLLELNQTIDKFNNTIYTPQLVNTLLEIGKVDPLSKKLFDIDEDTNAENLFKNEFNLIEVVKKLESKVKKMNEENNELLNKNNELLAHNQNNTNELAERVEEINKMKRKLNDQKLREEELESSLQYVKQLNKDLESKMSILEEENNNLKKNLKSANERLKEFELTKNKNINLENELKYKESIISYLETLLKSNNINFSESGNGFNLSGTNGLGGSSKPTIKTKNYFSLNEESDYNFEKKNLFTKNFTLKPNKAESDNSEKLSDRNNLKMETNAKDDSLRDINSKYLFDQSANEYRFKPSYRSSNSPIKLEKEDRDERTERERDNDLLNSSKTSNLKYEIDNLDGEIKHLQNKLRIMIDINKNK